MKLTQAILDVARYDGKSYRGKGGRKSWSQCILWDDDLPGFGVRISPKHRKTFVVSYRAGGRKRMKTLGKVGPLSLPRARALAREVLDSGDEAVAARVGAPRGEKSQRAASFRTFAQLCHAYLEQRRKARDRGWRADRMAVHRYLLPVLGSIRLDEVGPRDGGKLRSRLVSTFPAERAALAALFNSIYAWGQERVAAPAAPPEKRKARKPRKTAKQKSATGLKEETVEIPIFAVEEAARREKAASEPAARRDKPKKTERTEKTEKPEKQAAEPPPPRFDRLALVQPFARRSTFGAVLSLDPEALEIETGFAAQLGEVYRFMVRQGEHRLELEAKVLACRLARTVRNRLGELEPRYRVRLEIERVAAGDVGELLAGL